MFETFGNFCAKRSSVSPTMRVQSCHLFHLFWNWRIRKVTSVIWRANMNKRCVCIFHIGYSTDVTNSMILSQLVTNLDPIFWIQTQWNFNLKRPLDNSKLGFNNHRAEILLTHAKDKKSSTRQGSKSRGASLQWTLDSRFSKISKITLFCPNCTTNPNILQVSFGLDCFCKHLEEEMKKCN